MVNKVVIKVPELKEATPHRINLAADGIWQARDKENIVFTSLQEPGKSFLMVTGDDDDKVLTIIDDQLQVFTTLQDFWEWLQSNELQALSVWEETKYSWVTTIE